MRAIDTDIETRWCRQIGYHYRGIGYAWPAGGARTLHFHTIWSTSRHVTIVIDLANGRAHRGTNEHLRASIYSFVLPGHMRLAFTELVESWIAVIDDSTVLDACKARIEYSISQWESILQQWCNMHFQSHVNKSKRNKKQHPICYWMKILVKIICITIFALPKSEVLHF